VQATMMGRTYGHFTVTAGRRRERTVTIGND
jgi:hypothetical protein